MRVLLHTKRSRHKREWLSNWGVNRKHGRNNNKVQSEGKEHVDVKNNLVKEKIRTQCEVLEKMREAKRQRIKNGISENNYPGREMGME